MPSVRGQAIRRAYADLGLTRAQFSKLVDVNPRTLTNITTGDAPCSRAVAARIARALGWSIDEVIVTNDSAGETTRPQPTSPGAPPRKVERTPPVRPSPTREPKKSARSAA